MTTDHNKAIAKQVQSLAESTSSRPEVLSIIVDERCVPLITEGAVGERITLILSSSPRELSPEDTPVGTATVLEVREVGRSMFAYSVRGVSGEIVEGDPVLVHSDLLCVVKS